MRAAFPFLLILAVALGVGWLVRDRIRTEDEPAQSTETKEERVAPVSVAPVVRGPIALRRTFIGALESPAEFVVAPKVGGRIKSVAVDIADDVRRGQVVAVLDDDEFVQAVVQAEADLAVAKANLGEADSALIIAERGLKRVETLRERGVASESQYDLAKAEQLAKGARAVVAKAQVTRAQAALRAAEIRLGYTQVSASWTDGGDEKRVVAERFAQAGDTVSANAPLLSIVALDRLLGAVAVTERDFVFLRPGQGATLTTDAYPGVPFDGTVKRIAPVFREATRQARVELDVPNPGRRLRPGMFIRATIVLRRVENATIVPHEALTSRGDTTGVFVVAADGRTVRWVPVVPGIRDGDRVQVTGEGVTGRVVTLGQQLVDDGSRVTIPAGESPAPDAGRVEAGA